MRHWLQGALLCDACHTDATVDVNAVEAAAAAAVADAAAAAAAAAHASYGASAPSDHCADATCFAVMQRGCTFPTRFHIPHY